MKPLNLFVLIILCIAFASCSNSTTPLLDQLEEELAKRPTYKVEKENHIGRLRDNLEMPNLSAEKRMFIYEELYEQYATYQFDSAMSVVRKQKELAVNIGDKKAIYSSELHRIMLFATAGYFSELKSLLDSLPVNEFSRDLKLEYFKTAEWAYNRMADFLNDGFYSERYWEKGSQFQDSIQSVLPKGKPDYHYWKGCRMWNNPDVDSVISEFMYAYNSEESHQRLYAQATYNLSWLYARKGDTEHQKEFLIRAAISDQRAQLKESLALQELALLLKAEGDEIRANRYLSLAMEDARFYGNRLRMLGIAQKYPKIVIDYEQQLERANYIQFIVIIAIGILVVLLVFFLFALAISMKRRHAERLLIQKASDELKVANKNTELANEQLNLANASLREQTRLRESCISLFIELTAAYINKLSAFQQIVHRKVKVHQTEDLLKLINPSRMSEQDAREFFMNFDNTFLSTFPNFTDKINALLRPEERFALSDTYTLNLDLRILALIRLGVKDTAKIATLLNCSQQTVYNHRSSLKSRALIKETFENDIMQL